MKRLPRTAPFGSCEAARGYTFAMSRKEGMYERDLGKNAANYAPLTPLSFIERAAYVYPERLSVIHGRERYTWKETYGRCRRLASALALPGKTFGAFSAGLHLAPEHADGTATFEQFLAKSVPAGGR